MSNPQSWLQKILALWPIIVALVSGAAGTYVWVSTQLEDRVEVGVDAHNRDLQDAAHPAIQTRLEALEGYWQAHVEETNRSHTRTAKAEENLKEVFRFMVGDKAADQEKNPLKKAQAAREARERFRVYVNDGEGLKDAYRHALESDIPW